MRLGVAGKDAVSVAEMLRDPLRDALYDHGAVPGSGRQRCAADAAGGAVTDGAVSVIAKTDTFDQLVDAVVRDLHASDGNTVGLTEDGDPGHTLLRANGRRSDATRTQRANA